MKNSQIQQISIKGFLCRDNKVLSLKTRRAGRWELPGGRIKYGESVEEAFQREIKEEIGFENFEMGDLMNMWSFVNEEINHHFIVFDFEILTNKDIIKLSEEHVEYKWVDADEFEQMDMREGHKESLRKYFNN